MSISIEDLEKKICDLAREAGAYALGVADLHPVWDSLEKSFDECGKFPRGISIAFAEEDALLDKLPITDDAYRASHYTKKIAGALAAGQKIVALLEGNGHKSYLLSHPPKLAATGLYKLTARFAGLGWIGKNHLLITPSRGPRVALAVVLTEALLAPTAETPMECRCGDCRLCIDICPAQAFRDEPLDEKKPLASFNTGGCTAVRGLLNPTGWGGCGLCMAVCPFGAPAINPLQQAENERLLQE